MNTSGKGENSKTLNSINSTNLYSLKRNDDHVFEFTTKLCVRYKTYFLDYSTLFEHYPHIICRAYSFRLEVLEGNPASSPPDPKVGATIAEVIRLFSRKPRMLLFMSATTSTISSLPEKENLTIGLGNIMMLTTRNTTILR